MKHDTSPKEMLLGLYGMAYRYYTFSRGLSEAFASYRFDLKSVNSGAANALKIMKGLSAQNGKGCVAMMRLMERTMKKHGWEADSPVEFDLPPGVEFVTVVGLTKGGACKRCAKKPLVSFKYDLGDFDTLMKQTINNSWHCLLFHEAYRTHQLKILQETNFFNSSPDGLDVEAIYRACGGVLQTGLECLVRPTEAFIAHRLNKDIKNSDVYDEIVVNRQLSSVSDVELNRDWCNKCTSNLVAFDQDLFKLL